MVKLATARESRSYGHRLARNRWEYINAGLYVFSTILLLGGFVSQLSNGGDAKSGLYIVVIALILMILVDGHDLFAHLAGIDYRLSVLGADLQFVLVEFGVPIVLAVGSIVTLLGIIFILVQAERGQNVRLEKHALNMLIVGPALWVLGSIGNSCQVYERADGHVQILQKSVQIPFLMGSCLFLVGGVLKAHDLSLTIRHGLKLLGKNWVWLGIFGSLYFFIGGLLNVVKVFKLQQMDGRRLEKLRGGAQESLSRYREGRVPLILEDQRRRKEVEEAKPVTIPTPYRDVLVGQTRA